MHEYACIGVHIGEGRFCEGMDEERGRQIRRLTRSGSLIRVGVHFGGFI